MLQTAAKDVNTNLGKLSRKPKHTKINISNKVQQHNSHTAQHASLKCVYKCVLHLRVCVYDGTTSEQYRRCSWQPSKVPEPVTLIFQPTAPTVHIQPYATE